MAASYIKASYAEERLKAKINALLQSSLRSTDLDLLQILAILQELRETLDNNEVRARR